MSTVLYEYRRYTLMSNTFSNNEFHCTSCDKKFEAPKHCGKPMAPVDGKWGCWKGEHAPCCGKPSMIEIDACCDNQTLEAIGKAVDLV